MNTLHMPVSASMLFQPRIARSTTTRLTET
jgi:hypothetical protein